MQLVESEAPPELDRAHERIEPAAVGVMGERSRERESAVTVATSAASVNSAGPGVAARIGRWSVASAVAAAIACVVAIVVNAIAIWPSADTAWEWLVVGQLTSGAPRAVSLVDGNRVFPDLLFGLGVRGVTGLLGVDLLARHYGIVFVLAVLAIAVAGLVKMRGRSRAAAQAVVLLCALLTLDPFNVESLRPGYHAMSAAVALLIGARRHRRHGLPYDVFELITLAALVAGSRFLLVLFVIPLGFSDIVGRRVRAHRTFRLGLAAFLGMAGWLLIDEVPGVHVSFAAAELHPLGAVTWPFDYLRSGQPVDAYLRHVASIPLHFVLIAATVVLGAIAFLTGRLARLAPRDRALVGLTFWAIVIGGAGMRVSGYLVGWRGYIFVLPLLLACASLPLLLPLFVDDRGLRVVVPLIAVLVVVFAATNVRAELAYPHRGVDAEGYALLQRNGLTNRVGLTDYWTAYGIRATHGELPLYQVDAKLGPNFWVLNPWDQWFDRHTKRLDLHRRIDYVLSYRLCPDTNCDSDGFRPRRESIVATLGVPDRWIETPRFRLAVYDRGADSTRLLTLWQRYMRAYGLSVGAAR